MDFKQAGAQLYIPDGMESGAALARTTHLAIGAHQDDLEIMAAHAILKCFQRDDLWFAGVVVTNGGGSARTGAYANYSDADMMQVRNKEQKKAAFVGEFAAQVLLDHPSSAVKDATNEDVVADIRAVLEATQSNGRLKAVYTHNLADKHATHIGVTVKVIQAIRQLPLPRRPARLYGCEVWRDLDWMVDADKVLFDLSGQEALQMALVGVFDSQITGGKRYDLATMGRRRAHATYSASHATDETTGLIFGMDLTPLIENDQIDVVQYVVGYIERFKEDVTQRIKDML